MNPGFKMTANRSWSFKESSGAQYVTWGRVLTPSFWIKKANAIITVGYFFKIFVMALLLFVFLIVVFIVLPGRELNPKAEYIFCCRDSGRVLFLTCTTLSFRHCMETVTRFWPASCFPNQTSYCLSPSFSIGNEYYVSNGKRWHW